MNTDRPAPLVPAEVDLTDFQYMELDVQKLRDSKFAAEVDPEAFRAGVLLWCAAWHQIPAGSLPDNDKELSTLAGFGRVVKEWAKYRAEALSLFTLCSDGRLYHRIIAEKAVTAWNSKLRHHYDRARDRLRKANKARETAKLELIPEFTFEQWNQSRMAAKIPMEKAEAAPGIPPIQQTTSAGIPPEKTLRGNGEGTERRGNGEGEGDFKKDGAQTPAPKSAGTAPAAEAAATRGTRLKPDWELPKAWGEWALQEFPHWTPDVVRTLAKQFKNHWTDKTGKDATKIEWGATWRNWCLSDITQRQFPKPKSQTEVADLIADGARLLGFDAAGANQPLETLERVA